MNPIGKQNLEPADLMKFAKLEELKQDMANAQMRTDVALRRLEKLLATAIGAGAINGSQSINFGMLKSPGGSARSTSSLGDTSKRVQEVT